MAKVGQARLTHRAFLRWCGLAVAGAGAAGVSRVVTPPKTAFAAPTTFTDDVYISPGKLGIGTTVPGSLLTVYHSSDPRCEIRSDSGYMYLSKVTGDWNGTTSPFVLQANNTGDIVVTPKLNMPGDGIVIKQSGNVGIGTTIPQGKLDVAGEVRINGIAAIDSGGVAKQSYYAS
ncbi:MAG: hypothetical protein HY331_05445 [Chloroflexi bacterium]|nr:hypothetical protein [Chloroflexota bacterium]